MSRGTSRCPRCRGAKVRQDREGVWFCATCAHEFEPYVVNAETEIRPYSGAECPRTGRAHRVQGDRCIDCRQEA